MSAGITREKAIELLDTYIKNENMKKHCFASEAVMAALAKRLVQDQEKWAIAGLLHDLDVEVTNADMKTHGQETRKLLKDYPVDEDIIEAIELHNEGSSNKPRTKQFHFALSAGETITGLITATTLVYPDKKLASVKPKSVTKRMKEKAFAASVSRECIMECEKIGISLDEFAQIAVEAMRGISDRLGL